MRRQKKNGRVAAIGILSALAFCALLVGSAAADDPIVGQWNYKTSNHWSKGPMPAGRPSSGVLVVTQDGDQFTLEFKSGMVFNPPELKNYRGRKNGQEYLFANSAKVDNQGGTAKNSCRLKMTGANRFTGKSNSQYSNGGMNFNWGFDIEIHK